MLLLAFLKKRREKNNLHSIVFNIIQKRKEKKTSHRITASEQIEDGFLNKIPVIANLIRIF